MINSQKNETQQTVSTPIIHPTIRCFVSVNDKHHDFGLMDEAAQLFIPNIHDITATCRSKKVSFNVVAQDNAQFESINTRKDACSKFSNLNSSKYQTVRLQNRK
jgi:type IV secretory pathway TraG/TraD family ATPase VirD4